jgi:hypothetical protein
LQDDRAEDDARHAVVRLTGEAGAKEFPHKWVVCSANR